MKKILSLIVALAVLSSSVYATYTTLTPDMAQMGLTDSQAAQFCIYNTDPGTGGTPLDVNVLLGAKCRDTNGFIGCQSGEPDEAGFTVTPDELKTGADGCTTLLLETNLGEGQEGLFYYTVNGAVAESTIGSETGEVFVPEFGVLASGAALVGAGAYIARRRKK
ncbi:MAG TPA: hypothetical protein VI564_06790 [Candidatus Nanoarchaeia archaeon]|nr:hypothetical protein [Candidatus Nanoarchaeia archaeon]